MTYAQAPFDTVLRAYTRSHIEQARLALSRKARMGHACARVPLLLPNGIIHPSHSLPLPLCAAPPLRMPQYRQHCHNPASYLPPVARSLRTPAAFRRPRRSVRRPSIRVAEVEECSTVVGTSRVTQKDEGYSEHSTRGSAGGRRWSRGGSGLNSRGLGGTKPHPASSSSLWT